MQKLKSCLLGLILASACLADTVITVPLDESVTVNSWGVPELGHPESATATYGQTVTVPFGDTELASFTFNLGPEENGSPIDFQAYVFAWDSGQATGAALYQSAQAFTPDASAFTAFEIDPHIELIGGAQYVLFFSTSGLQSGQLPSSVSWGLAANLYDEGNFVYLFSGDNAGAFTTGTWQVLGDPLDPLDQSKTLDLAFTADFIAPSTGGGAVPEPSAFVLLGTVVGFVGVIGYRRRKQNATA